MSKYLETIKLKELELTADIQKSMATMNSHHDRERFAINIIKTVLPTVLDDWEYINCRGTVVREDDFFYEGCSNMTSKQLEEECITILSDNGYDVQKKIKDNEIDETISRLKLKLNSVEDLQKLQKFIENF